MATANQVNRSLNAPILLPPPAHRWETAYAIATRLAPPAMLGDATDPNVVKVVDFLMQRATDPAKARRMLPNLSQTFHLRFDADKVTRAIVEARLLSGEATAQIAKKCSLPPHVVTWYRLLFFDVADKLQHRLYILSQAIGARYWTGFTEDDVDVIIKSLAYLKGPVYLDYVLPYFTTAWHIPDRLDTLTPAELDRLQYCASIKAMVAAMTLPKGGASSASERAAAIRAARQWRGLADELTDVISLESRAIGSNGMSMSISKASAMRMVDHFAASRVDAKPAEEGVPAMSLAG